MIFYLFYFTKTIIFFVQKYLIEILFVYAGWIDVDQTCYSIQIHWFLFLQHHFYCLIDWFFCYCLFLPYEFDLMMLCFNSYLNIQSNNLILNIFYIDFTLLPFKNTINYFVSGHVFSKVVVFLIQFVFHFPWLVDPRMERGIDSIVWFMLCTFQPKWMIQSFFVAFLCKESRRRPKNVPINCFYIIFIVYFISLTRSFPVFLCYSRYLFMGLIIVFIWLLNLFSIIIRDVQ